MIAAYTWQQTGLNMMLFLVGLQGLPHEPLEAAKLDGCSPWRLTRQIVLPMLMPYIVIATLLAVVNGFKVFDLIWVMTQGGPEPVLRDARGHHVPRGLHPLPPRLQRGDRRDHLHRGAGLLILLHALRRDAGVADMSAAAMAGDRPRAGRELAFIGAIALTVFWLLPLVLLAMNAAQDAARIPDDERPRPADHLQPLRQRRAGLGEGALLGLRQQPDLRGRSARWARCSFRRSLPTASCG